MSRPVDGELQGGHQQGDDQGQGHGDDHGRGQEPNPFWSEEVREENLLTQARPTGLPDETPSEKLLDLDLDEDELRTAGESTPRSWEPLVHVSVGWPTGVATRGTSRSSSGGVLGDSRLQSLLEADLAEGGTGARQGAQHTTWGTPRPRWTRTGSWTSSML